MSNTVSRTRKNRRESILQALAIMLESEDGTNRITTAKLAKKIGISEAALYRYFPSKAKMFDALIEYIEDVITVRINLILKEEKNTTLRLELIIGLLLGFVEKNPGLARIMTGHALMFEQDSLQTRLNQLFERIETQLRQVIRESKLREDVNFSGDERILAGQILALCEGLMLRFTRTGFRYPPNENLSQHCALLIKQLQ